MLDITSQTESPWYRQCCLAISSWAVFDLVTKELNANLPDDLEYTSGIESTYSQDDQQKRRQVDGYFLTTDYHTGDACNLHQNQLKLCEVDQIYRDETTWFREKV